MKIHVLQCGSIRVDPTVPFGKRLDLIEAAKQLTAADKNRITLPVFTYLIEHPQGLILVDTGWCREISPDGVYDPKAAAAVLPSQMAALFHPFVPKGMAIHEQLAGMGIGPEDLDYVLLTHLDVDHVAGLRHVSKAKHIVLPEYILLVLPHRVQDPAAAGALDPIPHGAPVLPGLVTRPEPLGHRSFRGREPPAGQCARSYGRPGGDRDPKRR